MYEQRTLGGGLGYTEDRLRTIWDADPFTVDVLRTMTQQDGTGPTFGEDFLWALLVTRTATG